MKKIDERYVQNQCFIQFTQKYCTPNNEPQLCMHSVINGVGISIPDTIPKIYHDKIRALIANFIDIQKSLGLIQGVSDSLIHGVLGRCVWVEFKEQSGKQRDAQIRQQKRTEKNGGVYIMPRSVEEFWQKINPHIPWLLGINS